MAASSLIVDRRATIVVTSYLVVLDNLCQCQLKVKSRLEDSARKLRTVKVVVCRIESDWRRRNGPEKGTGMIRVQLVTDGGYIGPRPVRVSLLYGRRAAGMGRREEAMW